MSIKDTVSLTKLAQRINHKPKKVNNSSLWAGSPMYFYCLICDHQSDILPENYISPPKRYCGACQEIKKDNPELTDNAIISEAEKLVSTT